MGVLYRFLRWPQPFRSSLWSLLGVCLIPLRWGHPGTITGELLFGYLVSLKNGWSIRLYYCFGWRTCEVRLYQNKLNTLFLFQNHSKASIKHFFSYFWTFSLLHKVSTVVNYFLIMAICFSLLIYFSLYEIQIRQKKKQTNISETICENYQILKKTLITIYLNIAVFFTAFPRAKWSTFKCCVCKYWLWR